MKHLVSTEGKILRSIATGRASTTPTREEVRAFVEYSERTAQEVRAHGGNPAHVSIEMKDAILQFALLLPEDQRQTFVDMCADELNAINVFEGAKAEQRDMSNLRTASANYAMASIGGTIVLIILVSMIMRML